MEEGDEEDEEDERGRRSIQLLTAVCHFLHLDPQHQEDEGDEVVVLRAIMWEGWRQIED